MYWNTVLPWSRFLYCTSRQTVVHMPNSACCLFLSVRFSWCTATLVLCTVYGCFCTTTAELSSCDREHLALKNQKYLLPSLHRKSMPTPDINHRNTKCIINFLVQKFTNSFNFKLPRLNFENVENLVRSSTHGNS